MQKGKTDEAERWKTKYLHNLDELEHKEKEWAELEAMLHRGIGRLAVSGYGINPLLDRKLDKLREGVRRRRNSKDLDGMISIVSDTAIRLKEPDKQGSPPLPTKFLVTLLEGLELPPDLAREGKKLHKRLEKASESDDPAPLLESFKTLLHKGLNSQAPPGEATESSPPPQPQRGFLKRLLAPATPIPETAPTPAEIVPTPTPPEIHTQASSTGSETPSLDQDGRLLQLLLEQCELPEISHSEAVGLKERCATAQAQELVEQLVSEIAAFLSRYLQDPEEDSRSPAPDSRPATNEILLQLLERFEVSSDMQGQVDSLKAELASEIPPPKLPLILETMANLVADIRRAAQKEKAEIEAFLKDITDRLIELDSNLQQAGASRRESLANGQEFRNTVNTQVAQMRTSVSIATDLEQLKATIVDGLDGVQQHLETYILTEEKQNLDAEHQIQELGARLQEMESTAKTMHQRMCEQRSKATRDTLTGLYNRLAYDERIQQEFIRWKRYHDPLSLTVIDIDHFKSLNDTFGHQAGDKALKTIAGKIQASVRNADVVTRYGGEEFVIIMPKTARTAAMQVAEKLRHNIELARFHYRDQGVQVTISCGVAEFHGDDFPEAVFRRGDDALYHAKRNGRNQCCLEELME